MRNFALIVLAACASAPAVEVTAVAPRDCDDGTLVRDPRDRFSFCTPYNAWVSTMHAADDPDGASDHTFYALHPGTSFAVTVHARIAPSPALPAGASVEVEDDAPFHGRTVRHRRARVPEHAGVVEQWTAGEITVTARTQDDTTPALAHALRVVIGSFRWSR